MNEEIEAQVKGKIIEYTILIHQAEEGGFWVEVPALPGCYSQGETFEETIENIKEAIELNLLVLQEEKEELPAEEEFFIRKVKVEVPAIG
jgi:predicted RNase H-like HicB family nuclease